MAGDSVDRGEPYGVAWLTVAGVAVAVAVVAGVALVAWSRLARDADDARGTDSGAHEPITHVHGLGLNPADGALFVATHEGMFRLQGDESATRVGSSYQDTMGFTVIGPDHFLGSGHPDVAGLRDGLPGLLGLLESTDAGESWDPVSLLGEVDFHGLVAVHARVYAWDATSGRFMVSADRQTWETRSNVDLTGFAVDPNDAEHVIAATVGGLLESGDGARTWHSSEGPAAALLSWEVDAGLWAIESTGWVWRRAESGQWTNAGLLPGTPHAFLATPSALYVAVAGTDGATAIHRSDDGARSWSVRYLGAA